MVAPVVAATCTINGTASSTRRRKKEKVDWNAGGLSANPDAYPVWQPITASVIAVSCLLQVAWQINDETSTVTLGLVAAIFLGTYFLIDIISGLLHIILDNPFFADEKNWHGIITPYAKGFQEHHDNTSIICNMAVVEHIRPMSFPLLANAAVGLLMHRHAWFPAYHLAVSFFLVLMQMAHRWAHMHKASRPWGVTALQDWGVLVSPSQHLRHHKAPYAVQFCIMSGIMNPVLNVAVGMFPPTRKEWVWIFCGCVLVPHLYLSIFA